MTSSPFPQRRMRRLRAKDALRGLVAEHLSLTHLVRAVQLYHHHPVNAIWNLPMNSDVIQIIAAVKLADIIVHAFEEQKNPQIFRHVVRDTLRFWE